MHNISDVFQFLPDKQHNKYLHWVIMVSTVFLVVNLLENYSKYFDDLLALR